MQIYDIVRSIVTDIMLAALLFTLARPKYHVRTLWAALAAIVAFGLALSAFFYQRGDYTMLSKLSIPSFILISAAAKPLFRETLMQWLFNCLTAMNVYAVTVILSYYLCDLLPYPHYAITFLRFIFFAAAIWLFRSRLRFLYRQAAEHWNLYLCVAAGLFANFAWYFMSSDDVEQTLTDDFIPLLLLTMLGTLIYFAIFLSLKNSLREAALQEENLKIQSDQELTRQRLTLMDETVRQMSIAQHDRRHFNNTLLSMLGQGETDRAADLIKRQSEALPQKPQSYCQNVPVNAAVSYHAELARQRGIRCDLRLDIPEHLSIDELSLAMAVSNLMENAISAVSSLPGERRALRFTAVNVGQLILEMSNPYDGEISLDTNGLPTTREEGHGKGTQSVARFVKECGGELVYDVSGGLFKVRLMV